MGNVKKNFRMIMTTLSGIWLVFMAFHCILTGKISFWNFFGSLPTFIFIIIPLVFLVYEVWQRNRKFTGIVIAVFSLILGATQLDINIFRLKNRVMKSGEFRQAKVINWNTCYWDQYKDRDRFFAFLKKQKADIYILQEYLHDSIDWRNPAGGQAAKNLDHSKLFSICSVVPGFPPHYLAIDDRNRLAKEFPGYYIRTHLQFVLVSRFPIINDHVDDSEQYAVYDVNISGRLVRFFNVHMLLHIEPGNPLAANFYQGVRQRHCARQLGFTNLKKDIQNTRMDYFIAGDFNSTTAMGMMNDLLKGHVDGIQYSNELIPLSFEFHGLRLWRFDYGLVSKSNDNITIKSYQNIDQEGLSDHNPQSMVLNIKVPVPKTDPRYSRK
jgi:hypothetical protein